MLLQKMYGKTTNEKLYWEKVEIILLRIRFINTNLGLELNLDFWQDFGFIRYLANTESRFRVSNFSICCCCLNNTLIRARAHKTSVFDFTEFNNFYSFPIVFECIWMTMSVTSDSSIFSIGQTSHTHPSM